MEVGRDTLEVMGERSRAHQLAQQVATMTQQLAAQRCVATFLGSNEQSLREEIANLHKVCTCHAPWLLPSVYLRAAIVFMAPLSF